MALQRLESGDVVDVPADDAKRLKETSAFYAAQRVASNISERFGIDTPEAEIAYLAMHLVGRQIVDDESGQEMGLVISG